MSLDPEKAFDRVHWGFLGSVLQTFGLEGFIARAIKALYTNPSARVLFLGILSEPLQITDGTGLPTISHYICNDNGTLRRSHWIEQAYIWC